LAEAKDENIFLTPEESRAYLEGVYEPVKREELPDAPETEEYPKIGHGKPYKLIKFPKAPVLRYIIGPSAILFGLSLGSGETIFWPNITAKVGWAAWWMFWVGVLTQFYINTEIQRWTIATGESIVRAFQRLHPVWPWVMLLLAIFSWGIWPGWAAGTGKMFSALFTGDPGYWNVISAVLMVLIWVAYVVSPILYNAIEKLELVLVIIMVPLFFILVLVTGALVEVGGFAKGAVSIGVIPKEVDYLALLGGLAYAGAGGVGNLGQSLWAREKGYGLGRFFGRYENPILKKEVEEIPEAGFVIDPKDEESVARWRAWWDVTVKEHFYVFAIGLIVVTAFTSMIAAKLVPGTTLGGVDMLLEEARIMGETISSAVGGLFLLTIGLALFTTQLGIVEVVVRYTAETLQDLVGRYRNWDPGKVFLIILTLMIVWSIFVLGLKLKQPWVLLLIGANLAGIMMWVYNLVITYINATMLPKHLMISWHRLFIMYWAILFFGYFSVIVINMKIGATGSAQYVMWAVYVISFLYVFVKSLMAKLKASKASTA
jgi:hypothetical protein